MAKKTKKAKKISHEEISDAMARFLESGGTIQKIKYNDNGFLLKNDLALDDSYSESSEALVGQIQLDIGSESRV
tara:strand:+ start:1382 stop:1603 length:222 start_codon:yes stop_codon:yes gene_type:complete